MNYFAHFYFDHREGNPYYNTGLVLPDFARSAKGSKRIYTAAEYNPETEKDFYDLNEGCARHYAADKAFHNSNFFKTCTARLDELFVANDFQKQGQRLWFLSHILFELLLDRVLITLHRDKLNDFYNSLKNADLSVILAFLEKNGKDGTGNFSLFWKRFTEAQYLHYYTEDERFIYSLDRILMSAGQPQLENEQVSSLLRIIHTMDAELPASIGMLRQEL